MFSTLRASPLAHQAVSGGECAFQDTQQPQDPGSRSRDTPSAIPLSGHAPSDPRSRDTPSEKGTQVLRQRPVPACAQQHYPNQPKGGTNLNVLQLVTG